MRGVNVAILTETIIDVLDRHTAIGHFRGKSAGKTGLAMRTASDVLLLHERISEVGTIDLNQSGIRRLVAGYENHKYWHRTLESQQVDSYPAKAWQQLLPVVAEPNLFVSFAAAPSPDWRASPVPRAIVYPFGWSCWLSIRITGNHTLQDLATMVRSLFDAKPLNVQGAPPQNVGVPGLFNLMSSAVRRDVFGNDMLSDTDSQDIMIVTTILAKHGGSPSIDALTKQEADSILALVRPTGSKLSSLQGHVFRWDPTNPLEYIAFDDVGWFIWIESLLAPEGRNRQHLRCYHNNTVRSLAHARHLEQLLRVGLSEKKRPNTLSALMRSAFDQLDEPTYRNASLLEFIASKRVTKVLKKASAMKPGH